jgi:protease-4
MSASRAVLLVVVFVVLAGAAFMFMMIALFLRGPSSRTASDTVLVWDVNASLPEIEPPGRTFPFYLSGYRPSRPTVFSMTRAIRHAATDDRVRGLVLHIGVLDWGWARVEEVREAVLDFRESGKPVFATLEWGGELEYLLATAANVIAVPPTVPVQLDGLAAGAMFYKGTLDKLGISPNFENVGVYKSAVEQYTRADLSEPAQEALDAVLDGIYQGFTERAGAARGMSGEDMRRLVEAGPHGAREAQVLGLIDSVMYATELDSLATSSNGKPRETKRLQEYARGVRNPVGAPTIALVVASGAIAPGKSRSAPFQGTLVGAETLVEALRDAREDHSIEAIVLRVDSPGGSAQASDDILRELRRCREAKPLVVSMSDLAASGGYYIAMAADSIVTHDATQTGSIGIYGGKLNVRGLYEKLGLTIDLVTRGPHAGILSPWTDWSDEERRVFHQQLARFYEGFVALVAESRGMSIESVEVVARGRVWTGKDAIAHGLADRTGGLETAFHIAKTLAEIDASEPIAVERFPRIERSFLGQLLEDLIADEDADMESAIRLPPVVQAWILAATLPSGVAIAVMPWSVDVR